MQVILSKAQIFQVMETRYLRWQFRYRIAVEAETTQLRKVHHCVRQCVKLITIKMQFLKPIELHHKVRHLIQISPVEDESSHLAPTGRRIRPAHERSSTEIHVRGHRRALSTPPLPPGYSPAFPVRPLNFFGSYQQS